MKIFAIADIHGHYKELMALYKKLPIKPSKDVVVFLGDHIDRGPDSKKVVEQLMKWKKLHPHWVVLYGNHEDLMLDALVYGGRKYHSYELWTEQGGKETINSYLPASLTAYEKAISQPEDHIPVGHLAFLTGLPRYWETEDYIFVHGGLRPEVALEDQKESDLIWIRDEFIFSDYDWGKKVIFGHTANYDGHYSQPGFGSDRRFDPIVRSNKIGIDTAVCWPTRNGLTAIELPAEKFYFQPSFD